VSDGLKAVIGEWLSKLKYIHSNEYYKANKNYDKA
jgi:hypothetical protein